jgi:hypothetical protein
MRAVGEGKRGTVFVSCMVSVSSGHEREKMPGRESVDKVFRMGF